MILARRQFVQGVAAVGGAAVAASAKTPFIFGIHPAKPEDVKLANDIVSRLPKHDYVAMMQALANLDKNEPWSSPNPSGKREPFNRRWTYYANPLLVRIWNEMGEHYRNDCQSFCGVTLGWVLKRDGSPYPSGCAASQNYLTFGAPVTKPVRGDIAVYTHRKNAGKGHVGIFMAPETPTSIRVLGANQLMSTATTCGAGYSANVIDERPMTASKKPELFFHEYRRPASHA